MRLPQDAHDIERLSRLLERVVRRWVDDEDEVRDIVQDSWIAALAESSGSVRDLRRWLLVVSRNLARRHLRSKLRRRRREAAVARPLLQEAVFDEDDLPALEGLVRGLPEPLSNVVRLRYFHNLSVAELATRLDVPAGTIKSRLKRGRGLLRDRLRRRDEGAARSFALFGMLLWWRWPRRTAVLGGVLALTAAVVGYLGLRGTTSPELPSNVEPMSGSVAALDIDRGPAPEEFDLSPLEPVVASVPRSELDEEASVETFELQGKVHYLGCSNFPACQRASFLRMRAASLLGSVRRTPGSRTTHMFTAISPLK